MYCVVEDPEGVCDRRLEGLCSDWLPLDLVGFGDEGEGTQYCADTMRGPDQGHQPRTQPRSAQQHNELILDDPVDHQRPRPRHKAAAARWILKQMPGDRRASTTTLHHMPTSQTTASPTRLTGTRKQQHEDLSPTQKGVGSRPSSHLGQMVPVFSTPSLNACGRLSSASATKTSHQ